LTSPQVTTLHPLNTPLSQTSLLNAYCHYNSPKCFMLLFRRTHSPILMPTKLDQTHGLERLSTQTYTPNASHPRCQAGLKGLTSTTSSPCNSIESCVPTLAHHACTTLPSRQTIEPLIYDLFILLQCYRLTSLKERQFLLDSLLRGNFIA
jgi:hypothetical protein